ncbi:MAG: hypothetical protein FJ149_12425 [Euryarchaeota archaeon]|nr:hypothetical protein [Euryarchaeota archaeon]
MESVASTFTEAWPPVLFSRAEPPDGPTRVTLAPRVRLKTEHLPDIDEVPPGTGLTTTTRPPVTRNLPS